MTRILVTTDGSELGHAALGHAQALAGAAHAAVTVLCVQADPAVLVSEFSYVPPVDPEVFAAQASALRTELQTLVPGARVRVEPAAGRTLVRAILDVAREENAALIVMSTHGRGGLGRALLGSVAEAVAHHAPVPVMLVRAGQVPAVWAATEPDRPAARHTPTA
ncbi:universal stress protein [Deinococcus sp. RIT780]|uniref:universal stress protein n=1 Tax=Deinococcus sp. RIT780 TaxID=2870472 RepID=UPI001C8A2B59|nr:universal stress protein [Deinococcus sp. RIT780]MBX8464782.1 universal stress protein [Deinococcus sp. RIT780]